MDLVSIKRNVMYYVGNKRFDEHTVSMYNKDIIVHSGNKAIFKNIYTGKPTGKVIEFPTNIGTTGVALDDTTYICICSGNLSTYVMVSGKLKTFPYMYKITVYGRAAIIITAYSHILVYNGDITECSIHTLDNSLGFSRKLEDSKIFDSDGNHIGSISRTSSIKMITNDFICEEIHISFGGVVHVISKFDEKFLYYFERSDICYIFKDYIIIEVGRVYLRVFSNNLGEVLVELLGAKRMSGSGHGLIGFEQYDNTWKWYKTCPFEMVYHNTSINNNCIINNGIYFVVPSLEIFNILGTLVPSVLARLILDYV